MIDKTIIADEYMNLKKVIYIEKDIEGNIIYPSDKENLKLYQEILGSKIRVGNDQFYHKENKMWYQLLIKNILDKESNEFHRVEYFEDITKVKEEERKLKLDALTSLIKDRNECNKMINEYIDYAINNNEEFAILIGDVDDFKIINDTYGHECGDCVLEHIGPLLLKNTRQSEDMFDYRKNDIVMRFGGDEFLVLLKNISLDDTKTKLKNLYTTISNLGISYQTQNVKVAMSFGYYHFSNDDIYREMYEAMNQDKEANNADFIRKQVSKLADDVLYQTKAKKKGKIKQKM